MSPFELGESKNVKAIEYLITYLQKGTNNEKRLAASAIRKLFNRYPSESEITVNYLVENLKIKRAPQLIEYTLSALTLFKLNDNQLKLIEYISKKDNKEYNKKLAFQILRKHKQNDEDDSIVEKIEQREFSKEISITEQKTYENIIGEVKNRITIKDDIRIKHIEKILEINEKTKIYPKKNGYIYLLKEFFSGTYKIGRTVDLDERIGKFEVNLPFEVELVMSIPCEDYFYAEIAFHKLFKVKRKKGEWFALTTEDINWLKKGKFTDEINFFVYGKSLLADYYLSTNDVKYAN